MTSRSGRTEDPIVADGALVALCGDFMAHWPEAPAHQNPVTAQVVVGWFRSAFKSDKVPDEAAVQSFVRWLNIAGPHDSDNVKKLTVLSAEYRSLSQAIETIIAIAPDFLKTAEMLSREASGNDFVDRMSRKSQQSRASVLRAVLMGATAAAGAFPTMSSGGKKKSPTWKPIARTAAVFIAATAKLAGHPPPNFNGGPALEVLRSAMYHLEGKERRLSQLREAFRRKI